MGAIKKVLLGRPLKNSEISTQKMSRFWGLPIMASDAVSSVAYAGEEILLVLVPALGLAASRVAPLVTLPIILLLLTLIMSYSQIIDHYPNGGGAYNVSKENLGRYPSLLAASSLIIDYIMTVAVSISSSVAAITSAFPAIYEFKVPLALLFLTIITFGNLRGVRESSKVFGLPTYIFIASMGVMIAAGVVRIATHTVQPAVYAPGMIKGFRDSVTGLSALVLLHAFSQGCTALTGVEAVSNAIPNFRAPAQKNAKAVLFMLGGIIVFIFGGTTFLEVQLRIMPVANVTVVSQIALRVFGGTWFAFMFYVIQIFTALILILAANTSYNGLPLLLYILAHDGFVPRQFAHRGTKLSFSNGIMFIFILAGLLIWRFGADTHGLIPMYTIGVFISFTLSQYGMVRRWFRTREKGWRLKSLINGFGALMTFAGTVIAILMKFTEGAWVVIAAIPVIMALMAYCKKHYDFTEKQLEIKKFSPYYSGKNARKTQCIVLVQSINKSLLKSLNYANSITDNITVLHVCRHPEHAAQLKEQWKKLNIPIEFDVILTPYRDIIESLDRYITAREAGLGHGDTLTVIVVKYITDHWYDNLMHNQTAYWLERILSRHKSVCPVIMPFRYNPGLSKFDTQEISLGEDDIIEGDIIAGDTIASDIIKKDTVKENIIKK
jgi:amino acid transporter